MISARGFPSGHPNLAAVQALLDPFLLDLEGRVQVGGADFVKATRYLKIRYGRVG